jgi:putative ABC transport system ATP-binding protein
VLEVHSLSKSYGSSVVFSNLSFQAAPGELVAILGQSGVGKSSFLNILAGLDVPTAGEVRFEGVALSAQSEAARTLFRRQHIGFVFQAFHVLPHLSVAQNVAVPLMLNGRNDPTRVAQMLERVGLDGFGARMPHTLSGGQLQRVAIARALVHAPKLVLADEPTGNLDPQTGQAVLDLFMDAQKQSGAITLLVTHSQAAAARADRVLELTREGLRAVA